MRRKMFGPFRVEHGVTARSPGGDLLGKIFGGPDTEEKKKSKANRGTSPERGALTHES